MMKIAHNFGKLRALAVICLALVCSAATRLSALDFTTLKTDTGFACFVCYAIYEDSSGFIWLGGQGVLMRCEGRRVKAYLRDPQDPGSFPGGQIFALAEDAKRRLLVSTDQGLMRFDPETDRFEDLGLAEGGGKPRVYSAIADRSGAVWASTDRAIYRRGPEEASFVAVRRHAKAPIMVFSPNCPLVQSPNGVIYAGTPDGLFSVAAGSREWTKILLDSSAGGGGGSEVVSLALDALGRLWIATWGGGFQLLAPGENASKAIRFGQFPISADVNARITTLSVAPSGAVLICCASEGVYRYEPETGKIVLFRASMAERGAIPDQPVFAAYEDARGFLWAGGNGAAYLAPLASSPFTSALAGNSILDIVEEKAGTFLLATAGSVLRWNRATGALRDLASEGTIPRSTGGAVYTEIIIGRDGKLWIGSWGGGVLRLDPATGSLRE
ncbi:MAG: hypothetical protein Q8M76_06160, partial [Spirochaetaceae bacterium]|nr:hypothetical protein [Spirochaetaceae bacterium]